jgi:predicted nuclease of predicted toxin-antitoxin system
LLPVDLLADEGVDARLIRHLREGGLSVRSVREESPGLSDRDVLARARQINCVLVTEDSDFGEWVFAHGEPSVGVVFLRYRPSELHRVSRIVLELVTVHREGLYRKFTTVTPKKIRMRGI